MILMLQNWLHTNPRTIGTAAAIKMRFSGSLSGVELCAVSFENSNYQPKPEGGIDRLEGRKI